MFTILLKKELKEFLCNYKSWLCFLFVAILPFVFRHFNTICNGWTMLFFASFTVAQFMIDSFMDDIKNEGFVFEQNLRISFEQMFFSKLIFAFALGCAQYLSTLQIHIDTFSFADILWIPIFSLLISCISIIFAMLTGGSEIAIAFAAGILQIGILALCRFVFSAQVAFVFMLALCALSYILCKKLWNSKLFRFSL